METRNARFIKWCKEEYPLHNYERVSPLIYKLRMFKSKQEIELMKEAIRLTDLGFRKVMKMTKPGVKEYEIEAEFIYQFMRNGGALADYTPIIASGPGACVLHYIDNDKPCKDGDLILIDVGASYANYNADMTRCIPVNGKFTKRQKDVYNAVLRSMKSTIKLIKPKADWMAIQKETEQNIEKELVDLGLLKIKDIKDQDPNWPAFKKYFMHNVSHFLGLDVHDFGYFDTPYAPGMVFTVEPGIYIREEGIGVRIENNVVLTEKGNDDLFKNVPVEVDEIEELMKK